MMQLDRRRSGNVHENVSPGTISRATFDGERVTFEYYDRLGSARSFGLNRRE